MLLGAEDGPWTAQDRLLALALTAHEDGLCPGCGHPKGKAYNPDASGWLEARALTCAGCAAVQQHGHGEENPPGQKVYVVDTLPPDRELRPWSL